MMTFGEAIKNLHDGKKVCRQGWNGKGMFLALITDWAFTHHSIGDFPILPFIAMKTADNKIVPWLASQTDVLATDWNVVDA